MTIYLTIERDYILRNVLYLTDVSVDDKLFCSLNRFETAILRISSLDDSHSLADECLNNLQFQHFLTESVDIAVGRDGWREKWRDFEPLFFPFDDDC